VLPLRAAAALLARASTADALAPLAAHLGCDAPAAPLDAGSCAALRLPTGLSDVRVARGPDALRALTFAADTRECPLREVVARVARRLAERAPHLLWAVLAVEQAGDEVAIAAWSGARPPRVVALLVDRRHVVDSDAETLCALAAAAGGSDVLTHARWLDVLGRESLTRRFYRALERVVVDLATSARGPAAEGERRELALLHVSRLLFLAFLEAKGWLDGDRDFLARGYSACTGGAGGYHRRVLLPLFFGTLNTAPRARSAAARAFGRIPFLNGGLFARTPLERRCRTVAFPDDQMGRVFGELLTRYRFTAREDRSTWSEAAIDPEMLGKAFESLMAARERRASGAFYTPQPLVERVTAAGLAQALAGGAVCERDAVAALRGGLPEPRLRDALRARLLELRVLDPACGSGAFLVHALEELAGLAARLGDARPPSDVRRDVLTRSIFGVDVNPMAVWLCELRLWLSVVIDSPESDPLRVAPLPNLDRHVRIGDSLAAGGFGTQPDPRAARDVARLRDRYARASGARKRTLARALEREERARAVAAATAALDVTVALRRDVLAARRSRDLFGGRLAGSAGERVRLAELRDRARSLRARRRLLAAGGALPFSFAAHFADVALLGGFDVVLGNPPWVRPHHLDPAARAALRREFRVVRNAAWARGAAGAHAGNGFAGQADLAAPFLERALDLLRPGGTLAMLVPAKLWRALAGGGVRRLLTTDAVLLVVEDWSESRPAFDAAVYPAIVVARRRPRPTAGAGDAHSRDVTPPAGGVERSATPGGGTWLDAAPSGAASLPTAPAVTAALHGRDATRRWRMAAGTLGFDGSPESPWLLLPPEVRAAFDRVTAAGTPLSESAIGRPMLGVKCGCNEAFVVTLAEAGEGWEGGTLARVRAGERHGLVERELLRPLLRGEAVAAWRPRTGGEYLVWTHGTDDRPLARLPRHAERWLRQWRHRLSARADLRGGARWWSLFRTDSASPATFRVVWSDFGRAPRAAVLDPGDASVALNSCYVARCGERDDALALAAILNGPLAAAWLNVVAEPARGGYRRYLGWTVALLPLPAGWGHARGLLAPIAARGLAGEAASDDELLRASLAAYRLDRGGVEPLLDWATG